MIFKMSSKIAALRDQTSACSLEPLSSEKILFTYKTKECLIKLQMEMITQQVLYDLLNYYPYFNKIQVNKLGLSLAKLRTVRR